MYTKTTKAFTLFVLVLGFPFGVQAEGRTPVSEGDSELIESDESEDLDPYRVKSSASRPTQRQWRPTSEVTKADLEERLPRSAPDALRYEPGVFVQQTAHSQGSAYIRGRTGQQTVLMFDDVRMNNSVWRQGPNQYFFTVDALTLDRIEVMRGSASTRYGSDAIGGVIRAFPTGPSFADDGRLILRPKGVFKWGTADRERGVRGEIDATYGQWGVIAGAGYRVVDQLRSGGVLRAPLDNSVPEVPRFEADGKTQRGTGFKEFTGDFAIVFRPTPKQQLKLAWYDYRQFDAPRTDACPPAYAPFNECLRYDEQFRDVLYLRYDASLNALVQDLVATVSYQLQHERRTQERPYALANEKGRDDVHTLGFNGRATTEWWRPAEWWWGRLRYGLDGAHDSVNSASWLVFSTVDLVRERPRGQYIDGSNYSWGGAWLETESRLFQDFTLRIGGRASWIQAVSPGEETSGSLPIDRSWTPLSASSGLEWWANDWLTLMLNADQGFRAPNLDDLTSRQQTGPGFQFENAELMPETSLTLEAGGIVNTGPLRVDLWTYWMHMDNAMARAPRNTMECPPSTPSCSSSWSRFQLVNLDGTSTIRGLEGGVSLKLPASLEARATLSYAWGEGPSTEEGQTDRVALSRIPPLNGTGELAWRFAPGAYISAATRWATLQDRLALQDESDARIPMGGTPGFVVFDLRAGYRATDRTLISATLENIADIPYRYHGSSVNGPGRSISVYMQLGL